MDYIKYIRNIVGHKEIMAIGVAILVLNEKDEVLLETRSDNGKYSVPGGALNIGEKVKVGAIRETFEETGIHFEEDEIINCLVYFQVKKVEWNTQIKM